jgi:hypothetical protein
MIATAITPEGLDVYRNKFTWETYDPSRGRTTTYLTHFYKHTIPPGLNANL